jgi:hypothetical protein
MVLFKNVQELNTAVLLADNRKANGVGKRVGWKTLALAASIAAIAKLTLASIRRVARIARYGMAHPGVGIPERHPWWAGRPQGSNTHRRKKDRPACILTVGTFSENS